MRKENANILVDLAALLLFCALCTTGLVLRWSLPAGSGRLQPGLGHPDRPVSVLWGLDRHQWGELHYWVAVVMALVLVLHLVLHRKWIVGVWRRQSEGGGWLKPALGLMALIVVAAVPLLAPVRLVQRSGSEPLTLGQTSTLTGVPVEYLARGLKVEPDSEASSPVKGVSAIVAAYYGESSAPPTPGLFETNCAGCHGRNREQFQKLLSLPEKEAIEALRQARPAGPHQSLSQADREVLQTYLKEIRALPAR